MGALSLINYKEQRSQSSKDLTDIIWLQILEERNKLAYWNF